ncbi:MAG: TIGR03960 family B12-binding radical SAM protein [bacterium]|nr:TIGR03960 family B12-binding radical SAM protein [bacterium]
MQDKLRKILPRVQKPGRYTDAEWNSVRKDWEAVETRVALIYPDIYEVGESHLGLKILYNIINSRPDALADRAYAPWTDMEAEMRGEGLSLFALESGRPLTEFDLLGITIQHELTYSNILTVLDMAGLPLRAADRGPEHPLVLGGGPSTYNPEPLAEFFDLFLVGEGEEAVGEILDALAEGRRQGLDRPALLRRLAGVAGVYVPSLYRVDYSPDGMVFAVTPAEGAPARVLKRIVLDLDNAPFPTAPIVPYIEAVHDRITLEIMRGCSRGCRFCHAGMVYRPVRERSLDTLVKLAEQLVSSTGYDEISLVSLSSADYSCIGPLVRELRERFEAKGINISLPSLRIDSFSVELAQSLRAVRKAGLTFAPEAGTQRLRNVINKNVTHEDILTAAEAAFAAGWDLIKLYFMIGLPTETEEDVRGIADTTRELLQLGRRVTGKGVRINVSVSSFVPKPGTPFQWHPQIDEATLLARQGLLKDLFFHDRIMRSAKLSWHDPRTSMLEGVLSRGDRRLSAVIEKAWRSGCRFDAWSELFRWDLWGQALSECGLEADFYRSRQRSYDEVLPWDHISSGVDKRFLVREDEAARHGRVTEDCRQGNCTACGACPSLGGEIKLAGGKADVSSES